MLKKMLFLTSLLMSSYLQLAGSNDGNGVVAAIFFGVSAYAIHSLMPTSSPSYQVKKTGNQQASFVATSGQQSRSMHTSILKTPLTAQSSALQATSQQTPASITANLSRNSLQDLATTQVPFSKDHALSPENKLTDLSVSEQNLSQLDLQAPRSPEPTYDLLEEDFEIVDAGQLEEK